MVRFELLGPLRIAENDSSEGVSAPKVRQLLALLLLMPNQVVSSDVMIDELWGAHPPRRAIVTLQTYVCHIRKMLAKAGQPAMLTTFSPGYVLELGPEQLDLYRFRDALDTARGHFGNDNPLATSDDLRAALTMVRGPVLGDISVGDVLRPFQVLIEEECSSARALRIQADLALGRYRESIGELKALVVSDPLDEWAHARLMEALSSAGRRNEALTTYQRLHRTLDRELGISPSPELQQLQRQILTYGLRPTGGSAAAL